MSRMVHIKEKKGAEEKERWLECKRYFIRCPDVPASGAARRKLLFPRRIGEGWQPLGKTPRTKYLDKRQKEKDKRQKDKRQNPKDKRQKTKNKRQKTKDKRQKTKDKRQKTRTTYIYKDNTHYISDYHKFGNASMFDSIQLWNPSII